jgi:hypothetical protein
VLPPFAKNPILVLEIFLKKEFQIDQRLGMLLCDVFEKKCQKVFACLGCVQLTKTRMGVLVCMYRNI